MKLIYPLTATTEASKLSVCFRLDQLLREDSGVMLFKFKAGEITEAEWKAYLKNTFEPSSTAIHQEIGKNIATIKTGAYAQDEALRLAHNVMGAKFQVGEITEAEWRSYLKNTFEPQSQAIHFEIGKNRETASMNTKSTLTLATAIVKEVEVI